MGYEKTGKCVLIRRFCTDFETDPHPALFRSVKLSLGTREIDCFDYTTSANPPILHRKEAFLTADHPLYAKFARLMAQEQEYGLLDVTSGIGTQEGWSRRSAEREFSLKGHRIVRPSAQRNAPGGRRWS
jgi:DNA phosphorothioation-associated putative methyltransferase